MVQERSAAGEAPHNQVAVLLRSDLTASLVEKACSVRGDENVYSKVRQRMKSWLGEMF